jgi:hypothetical protein
MFLAPVRLLVNSAHHGGYFRHSGGRLGSAGLLAEV